MTEKSQGSATQPVVNNAVGGTHKVCAEFEINMLEVIAHVALICVYLLYYTHTSKRRQNLNTRGCLGSGSVGCGREESHVMSFHMNSLVLLFFLWVCLLVIQDMNCALRQQSVPKKEP